VRTQTVGVIGVGSLIGVEEAILANLDFYSTTVTCKITADMTSYFNTSTKTASQCSLDLKKSAEDMTDKA